MLEGLRTVQGKVEWLVEEESSLGDESNSMEQLLYAFAVSTLRRLTGYRRFRFNQRDFLMAADSVSNISIQSLVPLRELRHAEMCDDSLPSRIT